MRPTLRQICVLLSTVAAAGCTSSDGNGTDASTDQTLDTSPVADAGPDTNVTDSGATDASASDGACAVDAGCTKLTTLHPPKLDAGNPIFCPFSNLDGGASAYCSPGTTHCCSSAQQGGRCLPGATACTGSDIDWVCEDPVSDCPTSQACCGHGTFVASIDAGCGSSASCFTGTYCAATCKADEIILCTSTAECPGGKTCTPFLVGVNQVGACR